MKIKWVKPCHETNVHYGYIGGEKVFYIFWDASRQRERWILRRFSNQGETAHATLETAQAFAETA